MAMVNIGSVENPIWVLEKALKPESPEGKEWWGNLATGTIVLEPNELDALLEVTDEED